MALRNDYLKPGYPKCRLSQTNCQPIIQVRMYDELKQDTLPWVESEPQENEPITLDKVKVFLSDRMNVGFSGDIKALIKKYGSNKVSEVNSAKLPRLYRGNSAQNARGTESRGEKVSENKKHALLSPSAAFLFLDCTSCARLYENIEEKISKYDEEGTQAHALSGYKLYKYLEQKIRESTSDLLFHNRETEDGTGYYINFCIDECKRPKQQDTP